MRTGSSVVPCRNQTSNRTASLHRTGFRRLRLTEVGGWDLKGGSWYLKTMPNCLVEPQVSDRKSEAARSSPASSTPLSSVVVLRPRLVHRRLDGTLDFRGDLLLRHDFLGSKTGSKSVLWPSGTAQAVFHGCKGSVQSKVSGGAVPRTLQVV